MTRPDPATAATLRQAATDAEHVAADLKRMLTRLRDANTQVAALIGGAAAAEDKHMSQRITAAQRLTDTAVHELTKTAALARRYADTGY